MDAYSRFTFQCSRRRQPSRVGLYFGGVRTPFAQDRTRRAHGGRPRSCIRRLRHQPALHLEGMPALGQASSIGSGSVLLAHRSRLRFKSWEAAQARVEERLSARVPGTAVFMSSSAAMLPATLVRHVERSRSLHETVILLTVRTASRPTVPATDRYQVERLADGYYRVVMQFGFMEEPKVMPVLEEAVRQAAIPFPAEEVTY